MPDEEKGCLTTIMGWIVGIFGLATLGVILTGDWENIIGASALLAASIAISYFVRNKDEAALVEKRKPCIVQ